MRPLFKFLKWFGRGAHPRRQWRYFARGQRRAEHARLRTFRLRFAPFALSQAALGIPWAGVALVAPTGVRSLFLIVSAFKMVGGGALAGALVAIFFPVRANNIEVRGRTFIGLSRRVRWDEIESVRYRRWLFASYLLVASRGERTVLWLPLFLCQQRDFERHIEAWLAPDHPLRRFLNEERPASATLQCEPSSCPTS
ncbi:hypothetical protein IAD21_02510 [Abditibacteriota bacterium]|nr:hypothetical protein IAD21_02510 [Abditibacteriota bacterium]